MRALRKVLGVTLAVLLSITVWALPAAASASGRFVDGTGTVTDDWANEATLCNGCAVSQGNYVGMWQLILAADGYLPRAHVDCIFGPETETATRNWQGAARLSADGIVGPETRGFADNWLSTSGSNVVYKRFNVATREWGKAINFRRHSGSDQYPYLYDVLIGSTGQWYPLHYDISTIPGC